jgi:hypothetical protein
VTGAEIAALKWLATLANSVLAAGLGDRLKKRTSPEQARERGFRLYVALGELSDASVAFVAALRAASEGDSSAKTDLARRLPAVSVALQHLLSAVEGVDPQLSIHVPAVADEIMGAYMRRGIVVSRAEEELDKLARGEEGDLAALVPEAEQALAQVEHATESLRAFLAQEFAFKESF